MGINSTSWEDPFNSFCVSPFLPSFSTQWSTSRSWLWWRYSALCWDVFQSNRSRSSNSTNWTRFWRGVLSDDNDDGDDDDDVVEFDFKCSGGLQLRGKVWLQLLLQVGDIPISDYLGDISGWYSYLGLSQNISKLSEHQTILSLWRGSAHASSIFLNFGVKDLLM